MPEAHGPPPLLHRSADFRGVRSPVLHDGVALSGLLLSAAGAAGLGATESPIVRALPRGGLAAVLLLDVGHLAVHTLPGRELLVLDVLVARDRDPQKAVDVFVRKLGVSESRGTRQERG